MNRIELDFSKCQYYDEIHRVLKEGLSLPEYYGANLDALWDCLYDLSGEALKIRITGISHLLNRKDSGEYINKLLQVFEDIHKECPEITFEVLS